MAFGDFGRNVRNPQADDDPYGAGSGAPDTPPEPYPGGMPPPAPGAPPPAAGAPPDLGSMGNAGGGGGGYGSPEFHFDPVPQFGPEMFRVPSVGDALNEPGYQFRLQGGSDALERSASARGTLRTGGTLKDILSYGQNFATQEYSNVFNRQLQAYNTRYQAQRDMFAPRLAEWNTRSRAEMMRAMAAYNSQFSHGGGGGGYQEPIDIGPEPAYPGGY